MSYTDLVRDLESTWHQDIPISKAMGLHIVGFDGQKLSVRAALEPNVNVHGTAFAGSLYSVCALAGWGMMHLQMQLRGVSGSIVIASGQIDYRRPVSAAIDAHCAFGEHDAAWETLEESGKARFPLQTEVEGSDQSAATFSGNYAILLR